MNRQPESESHFGAEVAVRPAERGVQLPDVVVDDPRLGFAVRQDRQFAVTGRLEVPAGPSQTGAVRGHVQYDRQQLLYLVLPKVVAAAVSSRVNR
jgi:hypothetical protein